MVFKDKLRKSLENTLELLPIATAVGLTGFAVGAYEGETMNSAVNGLNHALILGSPFFSIDTFLPFLEKGSEEQRTATHRKELAFSVHSYRNPIRPLTFSTLAFGGLFLALSPLADLVADVENGFLVSMDSGAVFGIAQSLKDFYRGRNHVYSLQKSKQKSYSYTQGARANHELISNR
jgi:hypothetical protein